MMQEPTIRKDQNVQFLSSAVEITDWTDAQIAERFPGTALLYVVTDDAARMFVHATTSNFEHDEFLAAVADNRTVKKAEGNKTIIKDGPLAVAALISSLPATLREHCDK